MPAWPDHAVGELAARQRTIFTRSQLLALGIPPRTIGAALTRSRIHRVHRGVYSLVPRAARPAFAAEQAALLACGPTAVLSHHSAARLHGLRAPEPAEIDITISGGDRGRSHVGVRIHRTQCLERPDHVRAGGLALTSVARTVVDLAPILNDRALELLIDEALKRTSRTKLADALLRHRGRPGTPRLAALLDPDRPSSDTWSQREERLLRLVRQAGLPPPEANVPLDRTGLIPDLLWREQRVIVEYDSYEHHAGPAAFHHDRDRHNHFTSLGYQVIHVTGRQLDERPMQVLVWIAVALSRAA